ncbi:MAG: sulfotransferase [Pseudomonadota bacterium]
MAHPLSGANLATLAGAFRDGGMPDAWGSAIGILAAASFRAPISALEAALISNRLPKQRDLPPPVFILGHWRSGTTHLYNTMSLGEFGYVSPIAVGLPWDMFGIASALRPVLERALPEHRWIDRIPVTPTSPQEDEIGIASMTTMSFYHGIYFPKAFDRLIDRGLFFDGCTEAEIQEWEQRFVYFMRKLSHEQGKPLLIKNPVYTARISWLKRLFPNAKFVYLHRNPFDVFLSMRNFYQRLLEVMALQKVPSDLDMDVTILRVFDRMMNAYVEDSQKLAPGDLVELRYEDLDRAPVDVLSRIYTSLDLKGFDAARPAFETYLDSVRSFRKNEFRGDAETIDKVQSALGHWIARWGYSAPEPRSASCG